MNKILYIGDVHATVDSLDECTKLMDFAKRLMVENDVSRIIFGGDLYHNFAIVRLEVMAWWRNQFRELISLRKNVVALVGNHDIPGGGLTQCHALQAHHDMIEVADFPTPLVDIDNEHFAVVCLPYTSNEQFLEWVEQYKDYKTIFCHQTLVGAHYDNGFFAPDGVDASKYPDINFVAGHIHTEQEFKNVWYPGAPRWMTLSDANKDKSLWILEFDDLGNIVKRQKFDTSPYCRKIVRIEETPTNLHDKVEYSNVDLTVNLVGPSSWISERTSYWKGSAKICPFPEEELRVKVRESDGISVAFAKYFENFEPKNGTDKQVLLQMVRERCKTLT